MDPNAYEVVCSGDDADWHKHRLTGIGASEIASAMGESPHSGALGLFAEKTGIIEPRDLSDLEWIGWGKRLEEPIRQAYTDRTGRPSRREQSLLRSKEHPWALATLDASTWLPANDAETWPLEIKNTADWNESDWEEGPPNHYVYQAHQQMLVTGSPRATVACLVGGRKLVWADLERDERIIRKIVFHGSVFWQRILQREAPDATAQDTDALKRMYPTHEEGKRVELPRAYLEIVEERADLKARIKEYETALELAENRLREALEDAEEGVFSGSSVRVTLKTQHRAGYIVKPTSFRVMRVSEAKSKATKLRRTG